MLFPDHTQLLLEALTKKIIDSIALSGAYCICLASVHRSNLYGECNSLNN